MSFERGAEAESSFGAEAHTHEEICVCGSCSADGFSGNGEKEAVEVKDSCARAREVLNRGRSPRVVLGVYVPLRMASLHRMVER